MRTKHKKKNNELQVEVYLDSDDDFYLSEYGPDAYRKMMVSKLSQAFHHAGQTLHVEDLAFMLHTTTAQIILDVEELKENEHIILPVVGTDSWPNEKRKKSRKKDCAASSS